MSNADTTAQVHPARVEALSRKLETLRDELEEEREERQRLEDRVDQLEATIETTGIDEVEPTTPDKRALIIRKHLWQIANNGEDGTGAIDKDDVKTLMPGLARTQRYEAMKRAAGGNELADSGSSDLSPLQGCDYEAFGPNDDRNTRVTIELERAKAEFGRELIDTAENGGLNG